MWPFTKQTSVDTTLSGIQLTDTYSLPVICDAELYDKGIATATKVIKSWINRELTNNKNLGEGFKNSILYQIMKTDIKFLAFPIQIDALEYSLSDNEISSSGTRFFDMIVELYTKVPTEVIEAYRGKFLMAMLYALPETINDTQRPTKEHWVSLLAKHPWIPFIKLIQEIIDAEDIVKLQRSSS